MVENAAPNLRSWVRQGIDVTKVIQAAQDAETAAAAAVAAAAAARAAADQAIAAANGTPGPGTGGDITPENITGSTLIGRNLLTAPGANYTLQQQAVRDIIGAPKLGTAATDAAPGTLTGTVSALTLRVAALEQGSTGVAGKDNIDVDTDGVPYWRD